LSTTPTHTPFKQTGTTNTADPSGWLYTLVGANLGYPLEQLGPAQVSSLWAPQSLGIPHPECPYISCDVNYETVAPASQVGSQANILATSTTTISSDAKTTATPGAKAKPEKQSTTAHGSTVADPVDQTPTAPKSTYSKTPSQDSGTQGSAAAGHSSDNQATNALSTAPTSPPVIVIGSTAITQQPNSVFIVSSQTLAPGSPITIGSGDSATVIAVHTSNSDLIVVIGSTSSTLTNQAPSTVTASFTVVNGQTISGVGGFIWYGIGGQNSAASTPVMPTTGGDGSPPITGSDGAIPSSTSSSGVEQQTTSGAVRRWSSSSSQNLVLLETAALVLGLLSVSVL
jgi:hypothetical protein